MKKLSIGIAVAVLMASCSSKPEVNETNDSHAVTQSETGRPAKVQTISSKDAKALLDEEKDVVVLDIRTPGEYNAGHLVNAQHMDFYAADFAQQLKSLDHSKPYLVHCAVGGRSREAVQMMEQMGFQQVYDATEGYASLKNAGLPVE